VVVGSQPHRPVEPGKASTLVDPVEQDVVLEILRFAQRPLAIARHRLELPFGFSLT
jgi:hypothetical protein